MTTYRVDYADGTSWHSSQGPPRRTDGVLAVVEWGDPPYRTFTYGRWEDPMAVVEGVELSGVTIPDDEWAVYLARLLAEPHPGGDS